MLNVLNINPHLYNNNVTKAKNEKSVTQPSFEKSLNISELKQVNADNLKAYIPSFCAVNKNGLPSDKEQLRTLKLKLKADKNSQLLLNKLERNGLLYDNNSNDGSSVLNNLYKIATQPRIRGLSDTQIISEVLTALNNPSSITQKFGDIPDNVANEIENETGTPFPQSAKNVVSSTCVVASMEFNLASRHPAEFTRFAEGLSGKNYSVDKNIKLSSFSDGFATKLWKLREFNSDYSIASNWEDVSIKVKPDRNAIVRARIQSSYKDKGERSCIDVLIQSALLNLGSQHTYDSLIDERSGKFNNDKSGLTDFEKNFVEEVLFEKPKISVVYQNIDEEGILQGYNCEPHETKQHILKSLEKGQNVIIGYTHLTEENKVDGGHEITIIGHEEDENGNGYFLCNDTDDDIDTPIKYKEDVLLPLIHHAGISMDALNSEDVIVESWREILDMFQAVLKEERNINK